MKLRIAEIFSSIQGEGEWLGTPSVFVRVSGCNLRCIWCDTPYASWSPEGPTMDVDEVLREVLARGIRHVVLTGGEPMLFEGITPLAEGLRAANRVITIETAGTVFRDLPCDLMSISPKLGNSRPSESEWSERHEQTRLDRAPMKELVEKYRYQLKFVVNPERGLQEDLDEIESILIEIGAERERVLLMAEGIDSEILHRRERLLVDVCLQQNFRLTPRFHVDLFGNKRGT